MSKIKIDYDHKDVDIIRSNIKEITSEFSPEWIRLSVSPSGRGFHLKFSVSEELSPDERINIRKRFGDDENRICAIYDNVDGGFVYRDVLFDMKLVNGVIMKSVEIDVNRFLEDGSEVVLNG
jgi:hypothetical protein